MNEKLLPYAAFVCAGAAHAASLSIDPLSTSVGSDAVFNRAELAAGETITGTTDVDESNPSNYIDVTVGNLGAVVTPSGGVWSLTLDDGTSGISGALDISSLSEGSFDVSATIAAARLNAGPVAASKDTELSFEGFNLRYSEAADEPHRISMSIVGMETDRTVAMTLTNDADSQQEESGDFPVYFGEGGLGFYHEIDTDAVGSGLINYQLSISDAAGNTESLSGSFLLDATPVVTMVTTGLEDPGFFVPSVDVDEVTHSGTASFVEADSPISVFYLLADGNQLRADSTVANDGTWSIQASDLVPFRSFQSATTVESYSHDTVDICALTDGRRVVVWSEPGVGKNIGYRIYTAEGASEPEGVRYVRQTADQDTFPEVVALNDGGFVIAFKSASGLQQQRFDSEGDPVSIDGTTPGAALNLVATGYPYFSMTALADGGWIVLRSNSSNDALYTERYTSAGVLDDSPQQVYDDSIVAGDSLSIDALGSGWVIGFIATDSVDGADADVMTCAYNVNGTPILAPSLVEAPDSTSDSQPNVVGLSTGGWVVAWEDRGDAVTTVKMQRFTDTGLKVGGVEIPALETTLPSFYPRMAALPSGAWGIVWANELNYQPHELRFRTYDQVGAPQHNPAYLRSINGGVADLSGSYDAMATSTPTGGWLYIGDFNRSNIEPSFVEVPEIPSDPYNLMTSGTVHVLASATNSQGLFGNSPLQTYDADFQGPLLQSITSDKSTVEGGERFVLTLTFDEPIQGLSTLDARATDGVTIGGLEDAVPVDPEDRTVWTLGLAASIAGNGNASFMVYLNMHGIRDDYNTSTPGDSISSASISLTPDVTGPKLLAITPDLSSITTGRRVNYLIEFSEPLVGFGGNQVSFAPASGDGDFSAGNFFNTMTNQSPNYKYQVFVREGFFTTVDPDVEDVLNLLIDATGVTDAAGNPLDLNSIVAPAVSVTAEAFQRYAYSHGVGDLSEGLDSDSDGVSDRGEFLYNLDPLDPDDAPLFYHSSVTISGEEYFAVTFPYLDVLDGEDEFTVRYSEQVPSFGKRGEYTVIVGADDLSDLSFPVSVGFAQYSPADDDGLPALPDGYVYRTLRMTQPMSTQPSGFMRILRMPQSDYIQLLQDNGLYDD